MIPGIATVHRGGISTFQSAFSGIDGTRGTAHSYWSCVLTALVLIFQCSAPIHADENKPGYHREKPIPIADLKHASAVDFNQEILPLLKNNCLACHNKTTAKARLVLETPADMLKGGDSGPAVEPKKSASSLLLKAASHQIEDTIMPPPGNKVQASNLAPEELALIRLWIDQGAIASTASRRQIEWQPLPEGLNPIYTVALTPDGQFAACGRANQIFVYHLPTGRLVTRLTDPELAKLNANPGTAHRDLVQSLAFNWDGTLLASGGYREVKLWRRPREAQRLRIASTGRAAITTLAASPDGKWCATGANDGRIRLWTLATGKLAKTISRHNGTVNSLTFSPDSALLCSGSADKTIHVCNVSNGKLLAQAEASAEVTAVTWMIGGTQIASGGADNLIRIWDLVPDRDRLNMTRELRGHEGPVTSLETLASAKGQILSGSSDQTLRVWNIRDGAQIREMKHGSPVTAVAVRPDGKRFASAGLDHTSRLWDAANGMLIAELKGEQHAQEYVVEMERATAFSKSETGFYQAALKSAETNQIAQVDRVRKATEADETATKRLEEKQKHLADTKDARRAVEETVERLRAELKKASEALDVADNAVKQAEANTAATKSNAASEAKAAAGKLVTELKEKEMQAAEKLKSDSKTLTDTETDFKKAEQTRSNAETELQLSNKAFGDAEKRVADARVSIEKAERAQKDSDADLQAARISAAQYNLPLRTVAFSPDNVTLATAGDDRLVHTWSAENGTPFETFRGHFDSVSAIAFAPDGELISTGADRSLALWNVNAPWTLARVIGTGDLSSPLVDRVSALKFSPDGKRLATGGGEPTRGGEIALWDTATGKELQCYANVHSDVVFALDFTRDGMHLASAAADRFVKVIDLNTGKVVRQFEGHAHHVLGVSWKRDGRTLASAGADNLIKVWDFLSGDRKKNITGFDKEVTSITFVGYTDQALATSGDGRIRLIREDGTDIRSFSGATNFVYSAAATPDGQLVVAGGQDSVLRVWNGTDGKLLASFPPPENE